MENNAKQFKDAVNFFATTALEQVIGYLGSDSDIDGDSSDKDFRRELLDGDGEYFEELSAHVMDLGISHFFTPAYVARGLAAAHDAIQAISDTYTNETDLQVHLDKTSETIELGKPNSAAKAILQAIGQVFKDGIKRAPVR